MTVSDKPDKRFMGGFTLVEVMVAMLIVGLALPALLGQAERLASHTFTARDKAQAFWVAQNKMAEIAIDRRLSGLVPPRKESEIVELGRERWEWQVTTEETPVPAMLRVEVAVRKPGAEANQAWLTGFIRGEQ